jgi:hypothetical protein
MDIAEFLSSRNVDPSTLAAGAQAAVGLDDDDVLLAVGSLAEGLGTGKSDLDLLLITPRDPGASEPRDIGLLVGDCVFDIQVWPLLRIEEEVAQFRAWAAQPWDITRLAAVDADRRRLLHRLSYCSVIFEGESSRLPTLQPSRSDLARLKLQIARHTARTIQVDMVGNLEVGDFASTVFAAQELLGHAVDALTAGHHLTNPNPKWRSRLLELLPSDWELVLGTRPTGLSADEIFWSLHRAPERPERNAVFEHALRIVTFARGVFAWAERRLLGGDTEARKPIAWPAIAPMSDETCLPHLHLDVDFLQHDGRVTLGRLNASGDALDLTVGEFAVMLLFDGRTTTREAATFVHGATADEAGRPLVDAVISRVTKAGFAVAS